MLKSAPQQLENLSQQEVEESQKEKKVTDERDKESADGERERPVSMPRCLFAEMLGTFMLTTVAAGGEVVAAVSHGEVSTAARVVAPGLVVMALIYAIGDVSGAHFNPAVTFGFALRRAFSWTRVPAYWAAQLAGAILAAALLRALFGLVAHLGASRPHHGMAQGFAVEVLLTTLLVLVILGTASGHRLTGHNAGVAVGATIALCGLVAAPISGASMNPARSLGPAIVSGTLASAWIYIAAPLLGAIVAVTFVWIMHGPPDRHEADTASGPKDKKAS